MFDLFEDYLKGTVYKTKTHDIYLENEVIGKIVKVESRLGRNLDGTISFMVSYICIIDDNECSNCSDGYIENVFRKLKNKNSNYNAEAVKETTIVSNRYKNS